MPNFAQLTVDRSERGIWRVTFRNPPINLLEPSTIVELQARQADQAICRELGLSRKVVRKVLRSEATQYGRTRAKRRASG